MSAGFWIALPIAGDIVAISYLAFLDIKGGTYIPKLQSYLAELAMIVAVIPLFFFDFGYALIQLMVGAAIWFMVFAPMTRLFARLDREVMLITLFNALPCAVFAIALYMLGMMAKARFTSRLQLPFPALLGFAVLFVLASVVLLPWSL